ncbi:hypothetical protein SISNIDRAFT_237194 [Sistotremastrum niveocremeum HHB9708]|uniref:Uncharacterized protein n=1 Tax=Sistotremastrum niveocremeum HHB9708 TaxID=1314777 RepID=A0A164PYQ0_9AGAM|nr:hypothetical protein SISNIDRAFT_237194 [Sistotremastrum niveocremeum HHB9708]
MNGSADASGLQGRRSLGYAKRGHAHGHLEDHGRGHEFSSACVDAAMPMLMSMSMPMIMFMIMSTSMIMSNTSITCPKTSPISLVVARGICPRESICPTSIIAPEATILSHRSPAVSPEQMSLPSTRSADIRLLLTVRVSASSNRMTVICKRTAEQNPKLYKCP